MSKESALAMAAPVTSEVRVNPVTGNIPENVKEAANPAVENGGVVPQAPSTQLHHLAKKEAKLLAEREAFKKEQEEVKALREKLQPVYDKAMAFEETRKKDPIKALREIGFNEKEIIDYLAAEDEQAKNTPQEIAQKIAQEEIKKFRDEEAKKIAEAQKVNDARLISNFKSQLSSTIAANPEKYEACAKKGIEAEDLIFRIAVEEARENIQPDVQSIADDVEEYYLNDWKSMGSLKKLIPKEETIIQSKPERTRTIHPPLEQPKPKVTTLTNKISATSASLAKPVGRMESREEKRARLEAMIRAGFTK